MEVVRCYENSSAILSALHSMHYHSVFCDDCRDELPRGAPRHENTVVYRDNKSEQWVVATVCRRLIAGLSGMSSWFSRHDDLYRKSPVQYFIAQEGELVDVAYHLETGGYGELCVNSSRWGEPKLDGESCGVVVQLSGQEKRWLVWGKMSRGSLTHIHLSSAFLVPETDDDIVPVQLIEEDSWQYYLRVLAYGVIAKRFIECITRRQDDARLDESRSNNHYHRYRVIKYRPTCTQPTPFHAFICSARQ